MLKIVDRKCAMASKEEWEVPNSDDERDEAFISCTTNNEACDDIPIQILEYYEQIERNKVLELKVKEFKKIIPVVNTNAESEQSGKTNDDSKYQDGDEEEQKDDTYGDDKKDKKSSKPSEFDEFDEPEECQGQLPKRTPKSGRMPKKRVGTLKNVISNLKRFRDMDVSTESTDTKNSSSDEATEDKSTSEGTLNKRISARFGKLPLISTRVDILNDRDVDDKPTEAGSTR